MDAGINLFDTSDFYGQGRAEELLGACLGNRVDVVIATKVGIVPRFDDEALDPARDFSPGYIKEAAERSLKRLQRDAIDLYQLHGPPLGVLERDETLRALDDLIATGKVRHVGVSLKSSHMKRDVLSQWLSCPLVSVVQMQYSVLDIEAVAAADGAATSKGIIARSVFGHGLLLHGHGARTFGSDDHRARKWTQNLSGKTEAFWHVAERSGAIRTRPEMLLRFALDAPASPHVLVGASSSDQMQDAALIAGRPPLRKDEREHLIEASLILR